jgi:outer membrane receptor protein involved in Fe transport
MKTFRFTLVASALSLTGWVSAQTPPVTPTSPAPAPTPVPAAVPEAGTKPKSKEPQVVDTVEIAVKRLDAARNALSPDTGSTVYNFDRKDISNLPLGDSTPLNQVILQSPGVVQDSFGQLHVRGDHGNLQYRVNGVIIPEAISGFGQALDTRFADQINILTGALPAQYGYRTAGIVDIQSKGTTFDNGGRINLVGGSRGHREGSAEAGGTQDRFSYYLTGSYLRNDLGVENPTPARNAIHDETRQAKSFGYFSYLLDDASRVSFLFGTSDNKFQIPDVPGKTPAYTLTGAAPLPSDRLDARQNEKNQFQVVTYQGTAGADVDYQVSAFNRYTDVAYMPDPVGDLVYNGIAAQVLRRNRAHGLQGDLSYRPAAAHTLRSGFFWQRERFDVNNTARVFPADDSGNQISGTPIAIDDGSRLKGRLLGVYLQDEWKPAKELTINYGARYDKVNTVVDEQQLSPRIGVVYEWSANTRFHAGYARYFTPPSTEKIDTTSIQKFLNTTNALPSDANTAVKSERSDYYDIGFSHLLTPQLSIGVDAYYRKVRHLQDEGQFGNALIFSAFNFERGKIYGIEVSANYRLGNFTAYANFASSRAMGKGIESGQFNFGDEELAYIARNWVHLDHDQALAASAGVSYRWGETTLAGDVLHGSGLRRGFANTDHLPGYTQFNVNATRKFSVPGSGAWEGRLSMLNVFDKSYQLRDGSGIGVGAPQFGIRRTVYVGLSKEF